MSDRPALTNDIGLGYVRVDEDFLGVQSVRLAPGGIIVVARRYGPAPAVSGAYRLFTASGEPVTDGVPGHQGTVEIPALESGQVFDLRMACSFKHIDGGDATITYG